jgi:hypothetical protein
VEAAGQSTVLVRAGISGARKFELSSAAEIRGAELAVKPEKSKADRAGKNFLTGENVVASRLGLDPMRGPRKLEKSLAHEQD